MEEKHRANAAEVFRHIRGNIPTLPLCFFAFAVVAAIVHGIACLHAGFADFINLRIGAGFRYVLAKMTDLFPFSVAETVLMALPLLIGLFIYAALRRSGREFRRLLATVLSILALFYGLFVFTIGCGYRGSTLDSRLSLPIGEVSAAELNETAVWLREEIHALIPEIPFREKGASVMPYGYEEMNRKLLEAYDTVCGQYDFIQKMHTRVKPVTLSEGMTYMHLTGVYTYMTGEANINRAFPDYTIPFTAAHELAHQRGIARENEANFVAFLVCMASDDAYIRYSGYVYMLTYTVNALYSADAEAYRTLCEGYDPALAYELIAYNDFYSKYENNPVGQISSSINNAYLQSQGTAGTRSYGMVVDLTVAYYQSTKAGN